MKCNGLDVFLEKVRAGAMPLGLAVTFTDSAVTELACAAGCDFLWFDGEHGEFGRETAQQHLIAVKGTGVASFYRVPACDHTEIKRIIDFAPAGVIVPMVMDEDDAARAVSYCRYPIHGGTRGVGPRRGHNYGADDFAKYLEESAHDPLVILQLEHVEAARRLDRILEVPGIDSIMVGPYDFSMSMGKPGQFDDPEVSSLLDECCRKVREKGLLLGCYAESGFDAWKRRGVQYMAVRNDTGAMFEGCRLQMARAREAFGK